MKLKLYRGKVSIESIESKLTKVKSLEKQQNRGKDAVLFVFLSEDCSEGNPLSTLRFDKKEDDARMLVFGTTDLTEIFSDKEIFLLEEARVEYRNEYVNDYHYDMKSYDKKIDQLNDLLLTEGPKIVKNTKLSSGYVSYSSNIHLINNILKDVVELVITKTSLIEAYINGSSFRISRGSNDFSPIETGKIVLDI